jgi:hypothetical protein
MVSFTRIPYDEVVKRAARQDIFLDCVLSVGGISTIGGILYVANRTGVVHSVAKGIGRVICSIARWYTGR